MKKLSSNFKTIGLWIPVILWSGFIFFWSSIPYLKIPVLGFWDFVFRKIAHMTEFAILAFLYFRAFNYNKKTKNFFWPMFISFIFAVLDEFHQHFVPGRYANLYDVLIDFLGIVAGSFLYNYIKTKSSYTLVIAK